ncbi:Vitamin B12-dependent ribonucleoside-diphosphate reductase [Candidatus Gugararchaeum adminiculabundum]|nr:Vitamin B12-dependent ribonucleoside-diphosphate reductase [Candidatus Gugararchaeum adminiculabundum]
MVESEAAMVVNMADSNSTQVKQIRKRDGRILPYDEEKVINAIFKSAKSIGGRNRDLAAKLAKQVTIALDKKYDGHTIPTVEQIQDVVEKVLIEDGHAATAKAYILYRQERARIRAMEKAIPEHVKKLADESKQYFRSPLCEFVYYRSYSRWIDEENRRETWVETVGRYLEYMKFRLGNKLTEAEYNDIKHAILRQEVMPSMRLLWCAGKAAEASNVAAYNCSYIAPSILQDFGEIMYLCMCGTGVGFSVEEESVQQLPQIKRQTGRHQPTHLVVDSKEGWSNALVHGLKTWYNGEDVDFDFSNLRARGARLKTMGGRSSGPGPLRAVLEFTRSKVLAKQGRRLATIDVHDIICKIGEVVVMGGVRRTALISLSDLDDHAMRYAKTGQFYLSEPQRSMANNSATYNEKPSAAQFLDEFLALAKSGTGERGIFNRAGLQYQVPERRWKTLKDHISNVGINPCGEIILRSKQFCNLSEVVARPDDTEESLLKKIKIATILGTFQATLTNFPYLSQEWRKNCEEESLLGVSITGQWDCPAARNAETMRKLRDHAVEANEAYAKRFGINRATAVTCVKPSGTVSQLVDAASGMHQRYSPYYIRRVRISTTDSLFRMMRDQKVPYVPEVSQTIYNATTFVLEFPVKAPKDAIFRNSVGAIEQLEYWKMVKENYTEHNPSVTISIGEEEWLEVAHWLYKNWNMLGGLSFLPKETHSYTLAPYEEVTKEEYERLVKEFPSIDFSHILLYEKNDETQGAKELACAGGSCDLV